MRKAYSLLIATALCMCLQAQKTPDKWRYASLTQGGIAAGSSTATYTAQTIQGIQKNGLFTGIGIGVDNYGMPGFPLVAHLQKSFNNKRLQPFAYGQTGIQIPWKKDSWNDKIGSNDIDVYKLKNGFIGELGMGYLFHLENAKRHAVSISAGYSYKYAAAKQTFFIVPHMVNPSATDPILVTEKNNFHYSRIALKIGFFF